MQMFFRRTTFRPVGFGFAPVLPINSDRRLRGWQQVLQLVGAIASRFEYLTKVVRILGVREFAGARTVKIEQT